MLRADLIGSGERRLLTGVGCADDEADSRMRLNAGPLSNRPYSFT